MNILNKLRRGIYNMFDERIFIVAELLAKDKNRLTVGLIVLSIGVGIATIGGSIIASIYIPTPEK